MQTQITHWYIIVNPAAGKGKAARLWPQIAQLLTQEGIAFEVAFTQQHRHATELAMQAIAQGHRHLIGVGGDGTNNEVINGIFQQQSVPSTDILYALLPIGTGNDWIKTHGIPKKLHAWLAMLKTGQIDYQDIGWVEYQQEAGRRKHFFANVAGMAYDAFVVHHVERAKSSLPSKFIYLWVVLRCLWLYQLCRARLIFNDQSVEDHFYTINVGICKYSGGGMQFVPHASPKDGHLALTYVGPLSKWEVIKNTYRFYNGSLGAHPKVRTLQVQSLEVQSLANQTPTLLEVDGEYLGHTPVTFGILAGALRFICPCKAEDRKVTIVT
ncbi:MAG: diacylglycerol kinase family lipid kinase [Saprospiraceae bacterium]